MTNYRVSFQYSERTYCTNIAKANSIQAVEEYYSKYAWYHIEEATESDLREAEKKGMPVIVLKGYDKIRESKAEEMTDTFQSVEKAIQSNENALRNHSTDRRWEQYQKGEISREEAVLHATKRLGKQFMKKGGEAMERIDRIVEAEPVDSFGITVEWKRSNYWGMNPTATVSAGNRRTTGKASGCGYDKRSAAVADALNQNESLVKILCDLKEKALADGQTDKSETACTGRDNRECVGYGAGYDAIPYYEGGVGIECFLSIFRKAGYRITESHTKNADFYSVYR